MDSDGYLCISIPIIMRCYLSNYEKITMYKSCDYGDPKYPRHQLQRHMIFMHLHIHRENGPDPKSCKHDNIPQNSL